VTVLIDSLRGEDVEALCSLAREVWLEHYPPIIGMAQTEYMLRQRYDPAVIRAELASGTIWWDVLRDDGALRAFAASFPSESADALKLDKLYVHPASHRRGFGERLVQHVCERGRERGYGRLMLAVNKRNASAIAAYRKYGFRIVDAIVKDIGGGFVMDDYIMEIDVRQKVERGTRTTDDHAS
jgi:ribosomal protein S18 acetylase RimI-like enzyme